MFVKRGDGKIISVFDDKDEDQKKKREKEDAVVEPNEFNEQELGE